MEPAPARAERLPRIPAVALPQRLGLLVWTPSLTASARFHPRGLELPPPEGPEPLPLPGPLPRPFPGPRPERLPEPLPEPVPGSPPDPPVPAPVPASPPGSCTGEMSFSALPLAWCEPPAAASVAAFLFNQKPGASGGRGVPAPVPPTMFQELGPGPTPATLPPSAGPLPEA